MKRLRASQTITEKTKGKIKKEFWSFNFHIAMIKKEITDWQVKSAYKIVENPDLN